MVLESKWADAPDDPEAVKSKVIKKQVKSSHPYNKKDKNKKTHHENDQNGSMRPRSEPQTFRPQSPKKDKRRPQTHPQTRLVFSTNDTELKDVKVDKIEKEQQKSRETSPKSDILKRRIEEQKRIFEEKQHKIQQEQLLQNFLQGDDKLDWNDEDEENQILDKLNKSLKV